MQLMSDSPKFVSGKGDKLAVSHSAITRRRLVYFTFFPFSTTPSFHSSWLQLFSGLPQLQLVPLTGAANASSSLTSCSSIFPPPSSSSSTASTFCWTCCLEAMPMSVVAMSSFLTAH
eukprot:TRINITY_DN4033_c0_g1_i2.p1 TRINITY_DN4033_c0_g1~~TRINITY_DN4033_c0_g1_i2.p1  ORF type:complete len:117 (-),score=20.32 TRINITY_DN4033_c0_g1_i2:41-391(-)